MSRAQDDQGSGCAVEVGATRTQGSHGQHTLQQPETILPTGLVSGLEHGFRFEFLRAATAHAHQMVVITTGIAGELEPATTLRQLQLLEQPHGGEQPQGAIHGGQGHPLLVAQQALVHLLGAEMAALTDSLEQGQHTLPLGGEPVPAIVEGGAQSGGVQGLGGGDRHLDGPVVLNNRHCCESPPLFQADRRAVSQRSMRRSSITRPAASRSATVTTRR